MDARQSASGMLKRIEIGSSRFIESNNLAIDDCVLRKIHKDVSYRFELLIEGFAPTRKEHQLVSGFHGDGTITIKLDFVDPLRAIRQLRDSQTLHRLDERGFSC